MKQTIVSEAAKIDKVRTKKKITKVDLCVKSGVSRRTYYSFLQGRDIGLSKYLRLKEVLKM